jgi:hypothetical protein
LEVAKTQGGNVLDAPVWDPLKAPGVDHAKLLDDNSARLTYDNGEHGVAVSLTPLGSDVGSGSDQPIDLHLDRAGSGFEPANPVADTSIPADPGDAVRFGNVAFTVGGHGSAEGVEARDKVFYANTERDTDTLVSPAPTGVETSYLLRSAQSPDAFTLRFDLPPGAVLRATGGAGSGGAEIVDGEKVIASVAPAVATDSQDQDVPVSYRVDGSELHVGVDHTSGDYAYPIAVDPVIGVPYAWVNPSGPARGDDTGWGNYSNRTPWCSLFINWSPGNNGLYTYGSTNTTAPCYGRYYTYPDVFEWNYYGEFDRWVKYGTLGYVYGVHEYASFNHGSGNMCRYSGIYSVQVHRWENSDPSVPTNHCDPNTQPLTDRWWCNSSCTAPTGLPPNYAVFGTGATASGYNSSFTNYLQVATVYVADDQPATVDAGSPGISAGWVDTATFSGHAHSSGLGLTSLKLTSSNTPGWTLPDTQATDCSADPANHCPPDRTLKPSSTVLNEGNNPITVTATDVMGRPAVSRAVGTVKVDRTPPSLTLSGTLYAHRNQSGTNADHRLEGLYDPSYTLDATGVDGTTSAPRSGLSSIDVDVTDPSGQTTNKVHWIAPCAGSDNCSGSMPTWTFNPDSYPDGDYTITVTAKDPLASSPDPTIAARHTTTQSFGVTVDRQGDIYHATSYEGDPTTADQLQDEWAQRNTQNARIVTPDDIFTRSTIACVTDPLGCVQEHTRSRDSETNPMATDDYGTDTGTSHNDPRLRDDTELLAPANTDLGTPTATGPIEQALQPWQVAPPAHGATYELYTTTDPAEEDGQSADTVQRLWIDSATRMPLRVQVTEGGQTASDTYYAYDRNRLTTSQVPSDEFSVGLPANVGQQGSTQLPATDPSNPDPPDPTTQEILDDSIALRQDFGLNADPTYVQNVNADPANDAGNDYYGVPLTPAELADLNHRVDAQIALDSIDSYGDAHSDAYAGIYIDQSQGGLVYVGFTQNAAANFDAVKALYPYPDMLRLFPTTPQFTYAQLQTLMDQIADDMASGALDADNVVSGGVDESTNRIVLDSPGPTSTASADLQRRYGPAVQLVADEAPKTGDTAINHRAPPNDAGFQVSDGRLLCTSGFQAYRQSHRHKRYYSLTAGHCTEDQGYSGYGQPLFHNHKFWGRVRPNSIWKAGQTRRSDALGARVDGRAHTSAVYVRSKSGVSHVFHVTGSYNRLHHGSILCHSGYSTRAERCGRVTRFGVTFREANGTHVRELIRVKFKRCWAAAGDSGGPVFTRHGQRAAGLFTTFTQHGCGFTSAGAAKGDTMAFSSIHYVLPDLNMDGLVSR